MLRFGDFLLAIALFLSIILLTQIANAEWRGYAANVSASFAFALLLRCVEIVREAIYLSSFTRFFGRRFAKNQFFVVYPEFQLANDVRALTSKAGMDNQLLFEKADQLRQRSDTFRVDLETCAATNDVRAMIEVAALFSTALREPSRIAPDGDWDRLQEEALISIGFTSNYVTHNWLRLASDRIVCVAEDEPATVRYGEFIKLITADPHADEQVFKSDDSGEVGIIAKFRPDSQRPDIVWFFCAGVGPDATVAASIFLSRKWRSLLHVFGEEDFLLVVRALPGVVMHPRPLFAIQGGQSVPVEDLK